MLINRNFAKLWLGQTVSVVGDEVFDTTLLLWVGAVLLAGKSYAPAVSSTVLVITSVVIILLGPIAGVFVDRWDRRRTMLRADLLRAVLVGVLILASAFPSALPLSATLVLIGVVVAVTTTAAMFFNPARMVLIQDIVPPERRGRASSLNQSAAYLAGVIGPPLAAPLLVGVGVPWAITVNAVSFLISYLMIRSIRTDALPAIADGEGSTVGTDQQSAAEQRHGMARQSGAEQPQEPVPRPSVWQEFGAGLRFARDDRLIRAVLVTAITVNLGLGAVAALDLYFISENLHGDPTWFGVLGGALGVGAVAGAACGGFLGDRLGHSRVVSAGLLAGGALLLIYSRLSSVWPAIPVISLFGLALGALNTALAPVVLLAVPRHLLGRITAVVLPANRLGMIISVAVSSVLVSTVLNHLDATVAGIHLGRIDSVFLAAGLFVMASGIYFALASRNSQGFATEPAESTRFETDALGAAEEDSAMPR